MTLRIRSLSELGKGAWSVAKGYAVPSEKPQHPASGATEKRAPDTKATREKAKVLLTPKSPEEILAEAVVRRFGDRAKPQFAGAVPGRKFTIDVAFPDVRLGLEVDGWQYHGRFLGDFLRDRDKDKELLWVGWRVLRIPAGEVHKNLEQCLMDVERALTICGNASNQ